MKLIFEPGEKESIRKACEMRPEFTAFDKSKPNKEYGIRFTVTDPAIASYILLGLMYNKLTDDVDIGINIKEININPIPSIGNLKEKLHAMIEEIV